MARFLRTARSAANHRADWLAAFAREVISLDSRHAGRIDWATANHLYDRGCIAQDAATSYVHASRAEAQETRPMVYGHA